LCLAKALELLNVLLQMEHCITDRHPLLLADPIGFTGRPLALGAGLDLATAGKNWLAVVKSPSSVQPVK
jgi:hypothetical protein